jgi:phage/conjugal plasmid C-4 type zinc finger TraR family protein
MSDIADDAALVQHNEIQVQASLRDIQERRKIFGCRVKSWQDGPMYCENCEERIPDARRKAIPGVKYCVQCAQQIYG